MGWRYWVYWGISKNWWGCWRVTWKYFNTSWTFRIKSWSYGKAKATVIEASLEKGRGPVANVIVQNGTLRVGDNIVCDTTFGRVKAITNDKGEIVKS